MALKKLTRIIYAYLKIVLLAISIYCTSCNEQNSNRTLLHPQPNTSLAFQELSNRRYKILTFLSLACEHCHYQVQALLTDHAQRPDSLQLVFLADVHSDSLTAFANGFTYDTTTTIFLQDENGKLAQQLSVTSYPTMFLYDTAGIQLQTIVGEAKPAYVYKFFHAAEYSSRPPARPNGLRGSLLESSAQPLRPFHDFL